MPEYGTAARKPSTTGKAAEAGWIFTVVHVQWSVRGRRRGDGPPFPGRRSGAAARCVQLTWRCACMPPVSIADAHRVSSPSATRRLMIRSTAERVLMLENSSAICEARRR